MEFYVMTCRMSRLTTIAASLVCVQLILVLLQAIKRFNNMVNSSVAIEMKIQIEYQRSLAQVQV